MTQPRSDDLRQRLIAAVEAGESRRSIAQRFCVAASTSWSSIPRSLSARSPPTRG
jgi:transposase